MGQLVYGSELSSERKALIKERIEELKIFDSRIPCLAVVLVGDDPASVSYVKGKEKACAEVGMLSKMVHLNEDASQEDVLKVVQVLNEEETVDGILVQLPLPKHINERVILNAIDPAKDVDGLHPENVARLHSGEPRFVPCTPRGIISILKKMEAPLDGAHAVVIGRSNLVGYPVSKLLLNENCTVTICHSHTKNLQEICQTADILIAAVGRPHMIDASYIREGAYVVDVGVNRIESGKLVGDVDTEAVLDKVTAITPVPKGVGPMTICSLLENTLQAYEEKMR